LFIFVRTTIYGKFVRAKVGNKSPTICTNSNAITFLYSSIELSFYKNYVGVKSYSSFFMSLSIVNECLSLIAIENVYHIIPDNKIVYEILLMVL